MFERLLELDIDWDNTNSIKDVPEKHSEEFKKRVMECLENCKSLLKNDDMETVNASFDKEIVNENFRNELRDVLNNMVFAYKSLETLRDMQDSDINTIFRLINDIFEYNIIRNDTSFSEKYEEYGLKSEKEMESIMVTLCTLAKYYVVSRYTKSSIILDFSEETGLNEEVSSIMADKIDRNYNQLQMVFLLSALSE